MEAAPSLVFCYDSPGRRLRPLLACELGKGVCAGFLNLVSTVDTWGWIILGLGVIPGTVGWRAVSLASTF